MTRPAQSVIALTAVAALASFAASAQAGFVSGSLWTSIPSTSLISDTASVGTVTGASINTWGPNTADYEFGGTLNGDPTIFLVENIKNNTLSPWTGYTIIITPDPAYTVVNGTVSVLTALNPSFQKFGPVSPIEVDGPYPNPITGPGWRIDYSGGVVNPGETTQFVIQFDITDTAGTFAYHIFNTPVPEPTSLLLLAAPAALFFVKRRRHAA